MILVDDDPGFVETLGALLRYEGYSVATELTFPTGIAFDDLGAHRFGHSGLIGKLRTKLDAKDPTLYVHELDLQAEPPPPL